mmetsp:Transcript_29107/g.56041  ORF Transcript_29107/g.56041 Transcript_29107/m.56041 type:complete len:206 (+) Transcript_29107:3883-4500(+)
MWWPMRNRRNPRRRRNRSFKNPARSRCGACQMTRCQCGGAEHCPATAPAHPRMIPGRRPTRLVNSCEICGPAASAVRPMGRWAGRLCRASGQRASDQRPTLHVRNTLRRKMQQHHRRLGISAYISPHPLMQFCNQRRIFQCHAGVTGKAGLLKDQILDQRIRNGTAPTGIAIEPPTGFLAQPPLGHHARQDRRGNIPATGRKDHI